jgi:hypothetical protein
MSDGSSHTAKLRERLTTGTEDKLGKALADLIENPLVTGTIGRAFDARERAAQAQELALSALNIPTAADIERLTRRLRSVSQRLEGIEDGVHRINRALTDGSVERRLVAMEEQLKTLSSKLAATGKAPATSKASAATGKAPATSKASAATSKAPATSNVSAATSKASAAPVKGKTSGATSSVAAMKGKASGTTRKAAGAGKAPTTRKAAVAAPKRPVRAPSKKKGN